MTTTPKKKPTTSTTPSQSDAKRTIGNKKIG